MSLSVRAWPRRRGTPAGTMTPQRDCENRLMRAAIRATASIHRWLSRATGGRLGRDRARDRMPVLVLTTIRRRIGRARTWPVVCLRAAEADVVVASNGRLPPRSPVPGPPGSRPGGARGAGNVGGRLPVNCQCISWWSARPGRRLETRPARGEPMGG